MEFTIGIFTGFIFCAAVLVREEKKWMRRIYKKAYQDARKDIEEENARERLNDSGFEGSEPEAERTACGAGSKEQVDTGR